MRSFPPRQQSGRLHKLRDMQPIAAATASSRTMYATMLRTGIWKLMFVGALRLNGITAAHGNPCAAKCFLAWGMVYSTKWGMEAVGMASACPCCNLVGSAGYGGNAHSPAGAVVRLETQACSGPAVSAPAGKKIPTHQLPAPYAHYAASHSESRARHGLPVGSIQAGDYSFGWHACMGLRGRRLGLYRPQITLLPGVLRHPCHEWTAVQHNRRVPSPLR